MILHKQVTGSTSRLLLQLGPLLICCLHLVAAASIGPWWGCCTIAIQGNKTCDRTQTLTVTSERGDAFLISTSKWHHPTHKSLDFHVFSFEIYPNDDFETWNLIFDALIFGISSKIPILRAKNGHFRKNVTFFNFLQLFSCFFHVFSRKNHHFDAFQGTRNLLLFVKWVQQLGLFFRNFSYLKSSYLIGERLVKVIDLFETDFKSIYEEDFSLFISFKRVQIPFFEEGYLWV